jgi:Spy/CpxP family protein refolding chaperone
MENSKFLKVVIVILLIINISTLAFMWMHKPPMQQAPPPPPPHERNDVFEHLTHELKLSEQQRNQYDQLRKEHHAAMESLQEKGRATHDHFFALLQNKSADSTLVSKLADSISNNQKQIELVTFYHFQKVRAICNPEQQKKFDEIIDDALQMMFPKPPPRR